MFADCRDKCSSVKLLLIIKLSEGCPSKTSKGFLMKFRAKVLHFFVNRLTIYDFIMKFIHQCLTLSAAVASGRFEKVSYFYSMLRFPDLYTI
jgi:hypothetical protein